MKGVDYSMEINGTENEQVRDAEGYFQHSYLISPHHNPITNGAIS